MHIYVNTLSILNICITTTAVPCPAIKCAIHCEFGTKKDRYGCDTCLCKPSPCVVSIVFQ